MTALKKLNQMALQEQIKAHPNCPYPFAGKFQDKTSNGLTQCIIKFLHLYGCQAERISTTGRTIDQRCTYTDILGNTRQIGSVKYIKSSMQKGSADISATIRGRSVKIEVKIKDSQSEAQRDYQRQVERAGGIYIIIRSFEQFYNWYNEFLQKLPSLF